MNWLLSKALMHGGSAFALGKTLAFILKIILARTGASQFGIYFFITETVRNISLLAAFGIPMSATRFIGFYRNDRERVSTIIRAASTMLISASVIATCGIIIAAPYLTAGFPTGAANLIIISSVAVFGNALVQLSKGISFGRLDSKTANYYESADLTAKFLLTAAGLIFFRDRITGAILGYASASVGVGVTSLVHAFRSVGTDFRLQWSGQLSAFAWPVGLSETVTAAAGVGMMIILSRYTGPEGVGFYGAGMALSSLVFFVPQLVLPVFLPAVTEKYARNLNIRSDMAAARIFVSVPSFLAATILILLIRPILEHVFGSQYLQAAYPLTILVAAHALYVTIVWIPRQILDMAGKTKTNLVLTGVRAAITLTLAWLLVPGLELTGAALAVFAGWTAEGALAGIMSEKLLACKS